MRYKGYYRIPLNSSHIQGCRVPAAGPRRLRAQTSTRVPKGCSKTSQESPMFSKLSLSLVLTASLACVGQVTTMGGYATSAPVPVNAVDAPLVATPDIALPGSGPAVGAPLTNANDPRSATGPSIYNPNYVFPVESAQSASFSPSTPASTNQNFELGIQSFVSGAPAAATPTQSLAEIARLIKARLPKASKAFDNESIAKLNAEGVRTGNLGPESSTSASTELAKAPANNTLVADS